MNLDERHAVLLQLWQRWSPRKRGQISLTTVQCVTDITLIARLRFRGSHGSWLAEVSLDQSRLLVHRYACNRSTSYELADPDCIARAESELSTYLEPAS